LATLQTMLLKAETSVAARLNRGLQLAISFPLLLVHVYQLVLVLEASNLGIIVCRTPRRTSLCCIPMRQLGDLFGIGYIMVICTKTRRSRLWFSLLAPHNFVLSTGLPYRIRSRSRDFGAPSFLGEVSAKRKMWGVPGPNSKTLIILQNSD
jgi:hypothetical protein